MLLALPNPTAHFSSPTHSLSHSTPLSLSLFNGRIVWTNCCCSCLCCCCCCCCFWLVYAIILLYFRFSVLVISCFLVFLFSFFVISLNLSNFPQQTAQQARPSQAVPFRFDSIHNARQRQRATSVRCVFIFGNDFKRISRCDKHSCKQIKSKAERERQW